MIRKAWPGIQFHELSEISLCNRNDLDDFVKFVQLVAKVFNMSRTPTLPAGLLLFFAGGVVVLDAPDHLPGDLLHQRF